MKSSLQSQKCEATTAKGKPCKAWAALGERFCPTHRGFDQRTEVIQFEGLDVRAFRGEDGMLVVEIDTSDLAEKDEFPGGDKIPQLRLWVNEEKHVTKPDGGWEIG